MVGEIEILPCPFCGSAPLVYNGNSGWHVCCVAWEKDRLACEVGPSTDGHKTKAEAIAIWNRRHEERLVRALRALRVMERYNPQHDDVDAYLLEWCRYGLGKEDAPPAPSDFEMSEEPEDE